MEEFFPMKGLQLFREQLGRAIHEKFRTAQKGKSSPADPSMLPWEKLPEDIKEASRLQADRILGELQAISCIFLPVKGREPEKFEFTLEEVELLAEMKHNAWMQEKLSAGWTYGVPRDFQKKVHSCLLPWEQLGEAEKNVDRQAVRAMDELLRAMGFEIHRIGRAEHVPRPGSSHLIFISAHSPDYHYAEQIYHFLVNNGLRVFLSKVSLPEMGIADYSEKIDEALDEAEHMIVVASRAKHLNASYVKAEWRFFINEKRSGRKPGNIITVAASDIQPRDLPPSLRNYEMIPLAPQYFDKILLYVRRGTEVISGEPPPLDLPRPVYSPSPAAVPITPEDDTSPTPAPVDQQVQEEGSDKIDAESQTSGEPPPFGTSPSDQIEKPVQEEIKKQQHEEESKIERLKLPEKKAYPQIIINILSLFKNISLNAYIFAGLFTAFLIALFALVVILMISSNQLPTGESKLTSSTVPLAPLEPSISAKPPEPGLYDQPMGRWIYIGEVRGGQWQSQFLDFQKKLTPPNLIGNRYQISVKSINVRDRPFIGTILGTIYKGQQVKLTRIYAIGRETDGYIWGMLE